MTTTYARRAPRPALGWGLGALALVVVAVALVFGARPPKLHPPFRLHALVRTDTSVRKGQPVRMAGVAVGAVTGVEPGPRGSASALVTMEIERRGLPLHSDARGRIRPRLLLEGNFFVDLSPGSPGRPLLHSGDTLGTGAITGPVQLDRLLSDLTEPTRTSLRGFLQGYGSALARSPDGSETAGQSLNRSLGYAPAALRDTAIVTEASLGTAPDDLSRGIGGTGRLLAGLAASGHELTELVGNFDRTVQAFAARAPELRRTIAELDGVARAADPSFTALDRALPPLRTLARRLVPGTRRLDRTITVTSPWLRQATALLAEPELGGLSRDLQPLVQDAARSTRSLQGFTERLDAVDACLLGKVLPVGAAAVTDPPLTTGIPTHLEALQAFVGLAGAAGGFDGNGSFLRAQAGGGTVPVKTNALPSQGPLFGNAATVPLGTRPRAPRSAPPIRTGVRCQATPAPRLAATTGGGP